MRTYEELTAELIANPYKDAIRAEVGAQTLNWFKGNFRDELVIKICTLPGGGWHFEKSFIGTFNANGIAVMGTCFEVQSKIYNRNTKDVPRDGILAKHDPLQYIISDYRDPEHTGTYHMFWIDLCSCLTPDLTDLVTALQMAIRCSSGPLLFYITFGLRRSNYRSLLKWVPDMPAMAPGVSNSAYHRDVIRAVIAKCIKDMGATGECIMSTVYTGGIREGKAGIYKYPMSIHGFVINPSQGMILPKMLSAVRLGGVDRAQIPPAACDAKLLMFDTDVQTDDTPKLASETAKTAEIMETYFEQNNHLSVNRLAVMTGATTWNIKRYIRSVYPRGYMSRKQQLARVAAYINEHNDVCVSKDNAALAEEFGYKETFITKARSMVVRKSMRIVGTIQRAAALSA